LTWVAQISSAIPTGLPVIGLERKHKLRALHELTGIRRVSLLIAALSAEEEHYSEH
jgi:hypothetical protein